MNTFNKSRLFVFIALFALCMGLLCGCGDNTPAVEDSQTKATDSIISTTENNAEKESAPESETTVVFYQGENDLELITVPQTNSNVTQDAENAVEVTEPVTETTEAEITEAETTIKKVELPFVPAI